MAMSVAGGSDDEPMMDINTTPLIDVMLVLLIMFIITIPVMTHAVKLDMPRPTNAPPPPVQPDVIDLEIDFDGTVLWNGTPVTVDALEGYFRPEAPKEPQPELHIRPSKRAKYDVVARVLASAQRNGMRKIGSAIGRFSEIFAVFFFFVFCLAQHLAVPLLQLLDLRRQPLLDLHHLQVHLRLLAARV